MTKLQKVLVVDASKVVRASLARYLKGHFEVCEDADGESAWQTLVLDSSIAAVISGCKLDKLDGQGLVERMRENRLCRLNRMPFFLLVSDSFSVGEKQCASLYGVSDFIPKGMIAAEMNALLRRFVERLPMVHHRRSGEAGNIEDEVAQASGKAYSSENSLIGASDIMGQVGRLAGMPDAGQDESLPARRERAFLDRDEIDQRLQELVPNAQGKPVGLLVFGLDGYDALASRHGADLARRIAEKISGLLADKIRIDDSIGHLAPDRIVIIAPQTNIALCAGFASRVCKALAAAQISLRGQRVGMSVSIGIAALPDDGVSMTGQELLHLAVGRVEGAMRAGGNRVFSAGCCAAKATISQLEFLGRLRELLSGTAPEAMTPCLGNVGIQIMPILNQIEQALHLGLPIEDLGRRLGELAQSEHIAV